MSDAAHAPDIPAPAGGPEGADVAPPARRVPLPWGFFLAVAIVLAVDTLAFGRFAPWHWLASGIDVGEHMEGGLAADQLALHALRDTPDEALSVAVLGSSRAERGLPAKIFEPWFRGHVEFLRFCHAGMSPFELRALTSALAEDPPDVFVVLLSELDTHRPVDLRTILGVGSLGAVAELASSAGLAYVARERATLYGLTLASLLNSYRYRALWDASVLSGWRHFEPTTPELDAAVRRSAREPVQEELVGIGGWKSKPKAPAVLPAGWEPEPARPGETPAQTRARQADQRLAAMREVTQLDQVRSVTRGPHVAVQMRLAESMLREMLASGAEVLLVEGPLSPRGLAEQEPGTTAEFRDFARRMEQLDGLEVLWLEESGPFPAELFGDLTHLNPQGALQLSSRVQQRLLPMLERAAER